MNKIAIPVALIFISAVVLTGCAQSQPRNADLKSYPEVPPVAMDINWSREIKASPLELQYVNWVNGAGSTNVEFQRWLVTKMARGNTNASLEAQYSAWKTGPGMTNAQFQQWLSNEKRANAQTNGGKP